MGSVDPLDTLTARLASVIRRDELVAAVVQEVTALGFGSVWIAALDETTNTLVTVKELLEGVDIGQAMPRLSVVDLRLPIAHAFRDRQMLNIRDPKALDVVEPGEPAPPGGLVLPRMVYEQLRGSPFACGPLFGRRGQPVGALGVAMYHGREPIPDDLLAHGALRELIDHLGIALERVARIERLETGLSQAEAALREDARIKAVGEVASAVAHDLNNLAGIALLATGVGQRSSTDAVDMLPRIERATRAIGDLVARLQRMARGPTSDGQSADLQQIAEDILIMVKPMLHEKSIAIDAELPAVPAVRCDPVLVHQVVLNLVINAHDALAEVAADRRKIRLRLHDEGDTVRLVVSDTGPGIAPEVLPKLFQPSVTTKRNSHLGIGLAAGHSALKAFDGRLEGRNAPPGGAIFELSLVVAPPAIPEAVLQSRRAITATEPRRSARILAIDDDPDVVYIIRAYLEPLGYAVTTATGSAEALATATTQPFDLVLCDIGMPRQNGIDVCRSLRDDGYRGRLVLMTGWEEYGLSDEQRSVEVDQLLKKPFLGTDLIQVIDALVGA